MSGSPFDGFGRLDGMLGSPAVGGSAEHPADQVRVQVTVRAGPEAPPGLAQALQTDAEALLRRACEPVEGRAGGEDDVEVAVHGLALDREGAERLQHLVRSRVRRVITDHRADHRADRADDTADHDEHQGAS